MRDADRHYAMTLAALRKALELTQADVAQQLGVNQASVARLEGRSDVLVSTLRAYLEALGGSLNLLVTLPDREPIEIELGQWLQAEPAVKAGSPA